MDTTLPPVQKLVVPSVASVSGNRSMSFRPTLTPGGVSRPLDKAPAETVRNAVLLYSASRKYLQRLTFPIFCCVPALFQKGFNSLYPSRFYTQHPIRTTWKKSFWGFRKFRKNKLRNHMYTSIHSLCHEALLIGDDLECTLLSVQGLTVDSVCQSTNQAWSQRTCL